MLKQYHQTMGRAYRVSDAIVVIATWFMAYWMRFYLPIIEVTKGQPGIHRYAALTPLVLLLWQFVFSMVGVYGSHRILSRTHEARLLVQSHIYALIALLAVTHLFREYEYSRGVLIYFGFLGGLGLVSSRLVARNFLRIVRKNGFNTKRALIIGQGPFCDVLTKRLSKYPELGIKVAGHLAPPYHDIPSLIRKLKADPVIIALPRAQASLLDSLLEQIKDETVDIQIIPDIHDYAALGCRVEDFDGLPIVSLNDSPLDGWGAVAKRITDFICATIALIVLSPVLILIGILVKLTSKGPVFYTQTRLGLDGRTFKMYKFRSMKTDAEASSGAVWAKPSDDRRTAFGTFIRATSLDELPQFWNVFKGEMSLVGPRPERPVFVEQFRHEIPHYMLRHKVKAGITGWAQVNGWRGNTSLESRIECDLYYIRNWSYLFDWKILIMTVFKGFINKNAY